LRHRTDVGRREPVVFGQLEELGLRLQVEGARATEDPQSLAVRRADERVRIVRRQREDPVVAFLRSVPEADLQLGVRLVEGAGEPFGAAPWSVEGALAARLRDRDEAVVAVEKARA